MIVADASLIANLLVPPPGSKLAEAVLAKDPAWWAPAFWRFGLHSALLKYMKARMLTLAECEASMHRAVLLIGPREQNASSASVFRAGSEFSISSYDSEYVALARELRVSLVTFDRKLVRAVPGIALSPDQFVH